MKFLARKDIFSFRVLGVFLFFLFVSLAIYGAPLFLFESGWVAAWEPWNLLSYSLPLAGIRAFLGLMAVCSLCLVAGRLPAFAALALFYGLAAIASLSLYLPEAYWPYAGWMLLSGAIYRDDPKAFRLLRWGAWAVLGLSLSASGISKALGGNWWLNGSAAALFVAGKNPSALAAFLLGYPLLLKILTWLTLGFEMAALPLALHRYGRPLLLSFCFSMHLFIGVFSRKNKLMFLSLGMIVFYLFLYEISWKWPWSGVRKGPGA